MTSIFKKKQNIIENGDYVTLLTCTPYGINTHRLLVRGHRVENARKKVYISTEAFKVDKIIVCTILCIPLLIMWMITLSLNHKK